MPDQTVYKTRNLTVEETSELMRKLTIQIGYTSGQTALAVIASLNLGIFKVEENG